MSQLESSFVDPKSAAPDAPVDEGTPMLEADHAKRVASWIMPNGLKVMFDAVPYELCAKIETELNLLRARFMDLHKVTTQPAPNSDFVRAAADLDLCRKEFYLLKQDYDHTCIARDEQSKINTELRERIVQLSTDAQLVRQENSELRSAIVDLACGRRLKS